MAGSRGSFRASPRAAVGLRILALAERLGGSQPHVGVHVAPQRIGKKFHRLGVAAPSPRLACTTRTWVSASLSAALRMASAAGPGYRPKARMISMRISGSFSVRIESANCCEIRCFSSAVAEADACGQFSQLGNSLGRRYDAGNRIRGWPLEREPGGQNVQIGAAGHRCQAATRRATTESDGLRQRSSSELAVARAEATKRHAKTRGRDYNIAPRFFQDESRAKMR